MSKLRERVVVNGVMAPMIPLEIGAVEHIKQLRAMKIREDDVLIAAFPKSGTHWLWEVVQMLLNKSTMYEARAKEHVMMEFCPVSHIDAQESPRILNSHLFFAHLPEELVTKKTKTIHVVRNPKDVLVSMFHHFGDFMDLTWPGIVEEFVQRKGNLPGQFEFLHQMTQFQKDHPDHPVMLVYYEDMKKNPAKVFQDVAKFLNVSVTDAFVQEVIEACNFAKLKEADATKTKPEHLKKIFPKILDKTTSLYRKGIIGDWKNQFTVAQNEMFEALIEEEMKDLPFKFTYE